MGQKYPRTGNFWPYVFYALSNFTINTIQYVIDHAKIVPLTG